MKKRLLLVVSLLLLLSLICGCGGKKVDSATDQTVVSSVDATPEESTDETIDLDLVDTRWKNDTSENYFYFEADGKLTVESVIINTTTITSNGASSTQTSKSLTTQDFTWSRDGNTITVNDSFELVLTQENGVYKLVGSEYTYTFTDKDPLDEEEVEAELNAEPYNVNETISTENIEMTFTDMGVAEDIRITSKESGISITSGPSPESGKKFIYLKGTVKNLNTSAININMTGTFTIDGYTFDMKVHSADQAGKPSITIDPLDEFIVILYAPVSNELIDSFNEAELTFGFNDNFEMITYSKEPDYMYKVNY